MTDTSPPELSSSFSSCVPASNYILLPEGADSHRNMFVFPMLAVKEKDKDSWVNIDCILIVFIVLHFSVA
jgi:hypothetical protein